MASLWKISGTPIDVSGDGAKKHLLGMRYATPEFSHRHGACMINREGQMSSGLRKLLLRSSKEADLLRFGIDSPYLGWMLHEHRSAIGTSIVVELGWLELWDNHRQWMDTLGMPSPLMVCQEDVVDFLEDSDYWERALEDAMIFSIYDEGSGKYYGHAPPSDMNWPVLNSDNVAKMEHKIVQMKADLQGRINVETNKRRGIMPPGLSELFRSLHEFEFSEANAIPLIYFQEDD
jgi:hypothetical protein